MEGELSFLSPASSSCFSGGDFSSPPRAFPLEKLFVSAPSCVSEGRRVGNAGVLSSLPWVSPQENPLESPSSCVSDGRSGCYNSALGASAERQREVHEAERLLRSIAERYDDCFLRLRDATAEIADLRRERLRLGAENLHLSLLLEDLETEQRKQASAVASPKQAEEEAAQAGAPKSISIRSPGYLSLKQSQGQSKPQRLRVRASQATEDAAARDEKEEDDNGDGGGEVEVQAYRQGAAKTELCNKWERGACPYGERCRFAHGLQELRPVIRHPRYKTLPCQMFAAASGCPYGHRCHFRHSPLPAAVSY
uniref:C3H1-type domain-containing protein n=1 Tax=Oryza brachyantha TaxID=4533 RepID=J3LMZ2_ORYBR